MPRLEVKQQSEAVARLKAAACRLFAERGVDGVTVREIADAAGQRNHGAVGYHFGSKEALVRELVADGARIIDGRRHQWLDELEARGGPHEVRELVEILVYSSIDVPIGSSENDTYARFVAMLNLTYRELFFDALENRWNAGWRRCAEHIRRLMPNMPLKYKNHRLLFEGAMGRSLLAMRESALSERGRPHRLWGSAEALEHVCNTLTAMFEAPPDLRRRTRFGRRADSEPDV